MKSNKREIIETVILAVLFIAVWLMIPTAAHAAPPAHVNDALIGDWQFQNDKCRSHPDDGVACARRDRATTALHALGYEVDAHDTWFQPGQVDTIQQFATYENTMSRNGWTRAMYERDGRVIIDTANKLGIDDMQFLAIVSTHFQAILSGATDGTKTSFWYAYSLAVKRTGATVYLDAP